ICHEWNAQTARSLVIDSLLSSDCGDTTFALGRSVTLWPTEIREHSCRSGNCTRQAVVEFLGAALRTAETSLLRPWIQGRHAGLPSFRSTLWAPAVRYARLL